MLDIQLFGVNPRGYLFSNLLLHLLGTLLLYAFLRGTTKAHWQSAFVAALFALHPLHGESVAWIAQRKDVLSTLFWMLTMLGYARYAENRGFFRYLLVLLFFSLGLMAKPMLATLPCVLLLLDYWPLHRLMSSSSFRTVRARVLEKIPLLMISGAVSVVTVIAQQKALEFKTLQTASIAFRVIGAIYYYVVDLFRMFWPQKLSVWYPLTTDLP
jgi:hypothetical protein